MSETKIEKLVIIDGNAIIHRAYHALPPLQTKDGTMVNAVYGFTTMLLKILEDLSPDYLVVCFDVAGGSFREEIFTEYKATRVKADQELYDQIPLIHEMVRAFNIPVYTKKGYEADDLIGTIVKKEKKEKNGQLEIVVVSGDMDLLQLVNERVKVLTIRKGLSDLVIYDENAVRQRYGFGPDRIVDYKALCGDQSDNIPGVRGVGEKTATLIIQKFGGIAEIYKLIRENKDKLQGELKPAVIKKLADGEDLAKMSYKLATIHSDVPDVDFSLEASRRRDPNEEKIIELLQKFEFYSLLKRIKSVGGGGRPAANIKKRAEVKIVDKLIELGGGAELQQVLGKCNVLVCREIVEGENIYSGQLAGLIFFTNNKRYYLKFNKQDAAEKERLNIFFQDNNRLLLGHDLKRFLKILSLNNIEVKCKLFDVMVASYVLNSSERAYGLADIVLREFGRELPGSSSQGNLFGPNPDVVAVEAVHIEELYKQFSKRLEAEDSSRLFGEMEMKLISVLSDMELAGVAVDVEMLKELSTDVRKKIDLVTKNIWREAGVEFNLSSSVQLREVLFEKIGLPSEGIKKGKTGLSTAASELEKLRGMHPVIEMIENHRELEKLRNTYIDVLPTLVNQKTGRIHTSFNQVVAATGRLSSSDPNLQNIPVRTELGRKIREAFVAAPGKILISADYSQIELRIVASLAEDKKLMEIFKNGEDVHAATAAAINGVPLREVTKEMRYAAKEVNFGVLYGMGPYGLSWRTGISQAEAKDFIQKYFAQFAGVKKYLDQTLEQARRSGFVETIFGRRRHIPELKSENYQLRSAGERMAVNMPIQGTAADIMKMAMIAVHEKIESLDGVEIIMQVHDELVLEVGEGQEEEIGALVKKTMEGVGGLSVPIEVRVGFGKRWGSLKY